MKNLLTAILKSEDKLDNICTAITSGAFSGGKKMISRKIRKRISGQLHIKNRLAFGFLTNRVGLDPNATGVLEIYKNGVMTVHGSARIARSCKVYVAGELSIGDRSYINAGSMIFARSSVQIGSHCAIAWNCEIVDDDFHQIDATSDTAAPIVIGDHVWMGSHCSVLKGVTIGEGSMIGSRSVVTRNIPPNSLAVGIPAKVIRSNIEWS